MANTSTHEFVGKQASIAVYWKELCSSNDRSVFKHLSMDSINHCMWSNKPNTSPLPLNETQGISLFLSFIYSIQHLEKKGAAHNIYKQITHVKENEPMLLVPWLRERRPEVKRSSLHFGMFCFTFAAAEPKANKKQQSPPPCRFHITFPSLVALRRVQTTYPSQLS